MRRAVDIPELEHNEAADIARAELDLFLALLASLDPDDWEKPTCCTPWSVRQIAAHVAGLQARFASWSEFQRQMGSEAVRPYVEAGLNPLDARNQLQVDDRQNAGSADLITELREVGPRSIEIRRGIPEIYLGVRIPLAIGPMPISYLTDTILPRDMWMHRLDIAVATEHEFVQTAEHDGRISALVVRELAGKLEPILGEQSVLCDLRGVTGGSWSIGAASEPSAGVVLDALDFHLLASERLTPKQLHERSLVTVTGEAGLAEGFLENTVVLY